MKIALQVGAPDDDELATFIRESGTHTELPQLPDQATVSAYDQDRLIGLGWVDSGAKEPALQFDIAPEYERRGIRDHMAKLLLPMTRSICASECHSA